MRAASWHFCSVRLTFRLSLRTLLYVVCIIAYVPGNLFFHLVIKFVASCILVCCYSSIDVDTSCSVTNCLPSWPTAIDTSQCFLEFLLSLVHIHRSKPSQCFYCPDARCYATSHLSSEGTVAYLLIGIYSCCKQ